MRTPRPLPPDAAFGAFRSGRGGALGLPKDRLRRGDLRHPHRGVVTVAMDARTLFERCLEYEPLLSEGQVFSHTTALALWGAPVPGEQRLHVSVLFPRTPPRGDGIAGHSLKRLHPALHRALPVSSPAAAWLEAAAVVAREELVAIGDDLVTRSELATGFDALETATRRIGVPGLARARWALPRIRAGARSRPESLLRLAIVAAGIPEPVIAHPIAVAGGLVLHPDLAFVEQRVAVEYEGDVHRVDRRTWQRDLERRELLEAAGWRVIRVTARDLFVARAAFLARLQTVLLARSPEVRASGAV